ncbi:MAG: 1-(5-phosphoribosyl)-5-((5-phosphoribosylamino)methylideneamino)imidazole-4-carboxamide isomerase, partial [Alphaproteobacteria bacterium]|nr:1-(5-phosphoribosyl)-5-((5-phosphoribosylamino)methylideneamino)imidazole-4-carboxamide isomerase [Alphaproteobacteria bacterium]
WAEATEMEAVELAQRMADAGVAAIVYTDIERDGALGGANVAATAVLARACDVPVIASGGIGSLDDIRAVKAEADSGIAGVIVGRALYDGRVALDAALALLAEQKPC